MRKGNASSPDGSNNSSERDCSCELSREFYSWEEATRLNNKNEDGNNFTLTANGYTKEEEHTHKVNKEKTDETNTHNSEATKDKIKEPENGGGNHKRTSQEK